MSQHSRKHRLHGIQHLGFLQMNRRSFYSLERTKQLSLYQLYPGHWADSSRKPHNTKILYQLPPIYRLKKIRLVVAGHWRILQLYLRWFHYIDECIPDSIKTQKNQYCIVSTGHMRIVSDIPSETSILVLAFLQPSYNLFNLFRR